MSKDIDTSYTYKISVYLLILALPLLLMTLVVALSPHSLLSPIGDSPSRFLFFIVYFLPGLIVAGNSLGSLRKTLGIGLAYLFLSPAYYFYAVNYACHLVTTCF